MLDAAQQKRVIEWVAAHSGSRCVSCGLEKPGFEVNSQLMSLVGIDAGTQPTGQAMPVVAVSCHNCFNVRLFAAVSIGVVKRE